MTMTSKNRNIGHGEIQVTNDGGNITYDVDIPEGCPFPNDSHPSLFPGETPARKKHSFWKLRTHIHYPLGKNSLIGLRSMISTQNSRRKGAITGKRELEENAGNLALVVKNIIEDPEKKRKFSNLLRDILPFIEDFSVEKFMDISLILTMRERYAKDPPPGTLAFRRDDDHLCHDHRALFRGKTVHHHRRTRQPYPPVPGRPRNEDDEGGLGEKAGDDHHPQHRGGQACST